MNKVLLSGKIKSIEYSHEMYGERFSIYTISIRRLSGTKDEIPVIVSDKTKNVTDAVIGERATVIGEFRSYNNEEHLNLYVFATIMMFHDYVYDSNSIELDGYLGKEPIIRTTPLGRTITDVLLASNRLCGRTDYIPCVTWGRNAEYAYNIPLGTLVHIKGRIQSRLYTKDNEIHMAYEVSISQINIIDNVKGSA